MNELGVKPNQNYLLCVSGGLDSMVLLDLFGKGNLKFSVAHINYQLRGLDSDLDQKLISNYCAKKEIPFFTKKTEANQVRNTKQDSLQMVARRIRYAWFRELKQEHNFDWIVMAHHLDDQIETFILNLSRGSGLTGLTAMPVNKNEILRPLIDCSKSELLQYAKQQNLEWREDKTNQTNDYLRNQIRHAMLPELRKLHPKFNENFQTTIRRLSDNRDLIKNHIDNLSKTIFNHKENEIHIKCLDLLELNPLSAYLYHLFKDYGFKKPQELIKFLHAKTGSEIQSQTYRIIKNRDELILSHLVNHQQLKEHTISQLGNYQIPFPFEITESLYRTEKGKIVFDAELLEFPLKLRKRQEGDRFFPAEMLGSKTLSKYFKDEKLSKLEKEKIWLLCDRNDHILWVVGKRKDKRFLPTETTTRFISIELC